MRALVFHGPGDVRLEGVPRPEPGPGDVLVQVELALTDGTDLKAFRRGHPVLLGEPPSPFGHEFCGFDVATGRRVAGANSAPCGSCAACGRGQETLCESLLPLLNGAYAEYLLVPERIARRNLLPVPHGLASEVAALEPGGTLLVFADAGAIPAAPLYRRELTVVGSRSATPAHMREAVRLLPGLDLPAPTVLPLDRFAEGLELQRTRDAAKVVFVP